MRTRQPNNSCLWTHTRKAENPVAPWSMRLETQQLDSGDEGLGIPGNPIIHTGSDIIEEGSRGSHKVDKLASSRQWWADQN